MGQLGGKNILRITQEHNPKETNEVKFLIYEDKPKTLEIQSKKSIPSPNSEIEVRPTELTAMSDLTSNHSNQETKQKMDILKTK